VTTLSKKIEETERRAQALLADLIPLVGRREVAEDPEFITALEEALHAAEKKVHQAKTRIRTRNENGSRPRETLSP
jgi:hypothetical protein